MVGLQGVKYFCIYALYSLQVMVWRVLRIDRPDGRRVLKFDGAFGPEGCGIAFGHTFGVRVLKMDRPAAGGFLGLTAFQAEGCGIARRAMNIKSALRDWLSLSYGKITILLNYLPSADTPPIRLCRTSPARGGRIKF